MLDDKLCKYVSIIIPIYNAEKTIELCLTSVFKLNYPKDRLEIIVVDDGSVDRTLEIIKNLSARREGVQRQHKTLASKIALEKLF